MKDQWGRINNRCQAIRELNLAQLAYLLHLVKNDHFEPNSIEEWADWLEKESGESVKNI